MSGVLECCKTCGITAYVDLTRTNAHLAGEVVGRARVWGGDRMFLQLVGNGDVSVMLPRFPANQKLKGEIIYNGPLKAPIRKGDQVAMLRVVSSTEATNEVPLFAADDVPATGYMKRGFDTLVHMATRWIPL